MLIEWTLKEKKVKYITINLKEVELNDRQKKTAGGTVYKHI
jgi:hypothetical protein